MKRQILLAMTLCGSLAGGAAWASNDCDAPMSRWQPREAAGRAVEAYGWQVRRIRTDDGCYRVQASDSRGNRIEAELVPDTLELRRMKVEFVPGGGPADLCASICAMPLATSPATTPPVATDPGASQSADRPPQGGDGIGDTISDQQLSFGGLPLHDFPRR